MYLNSKTIICDVDDTICPSTKQIDNKMAKEINRLLGSKINFLFISGSTVKQIYGQISNSLIYEHHLMGTTGTAYTLVNHGIQDVWNITLTDKERSEIVSAIKSMMVYFQIEELDGNSEQLQDRGTQVTLSAIGRNAPIELKKAYDPYGERRKEWVKFLTSLLGDKYSIGIGGSTSIDITMKGIDKGWGVKKFIEHHKLDKDECVFYGDKLYPGGNDFPVVGIINTISVKSWEETLELFSRI